MPVSRIPTGMRPALAVLLLLILASPAPLLAQAPTASDRAAREVSRQIEARYPVIDDPVLNDRVGRIVERLGPVIGGEGISWRVRVIACPTPNAFALPNGFIYVHVALLDGLPGDGPLTDDELAFVLAHEMSHVVLNHAARTNSATDSLQRVISRSGVVRSQAASILSQLLRGGVEASYSREMEAEADDEALICMAQAGYDPHAALRLFDRMRQYQALNPTAPTLFHSHPRTADRYAKVQAALDKQATGAAGRHTPKLPVTLVAVVDASTAAALTAPLPSSGADSTSSNRGVLPQGTDVNLESPPPTRPGEWPGRPPGPPSREQSSPPTAPINADRIVRALEPLRGSTALVALPAETQFLDRSGLEQVATKKGADTVLLVVLDQLDQKAMPWPDGVVFTVDLKMTALLLKVGDTRPVERVALQATRQATLSAQGGRSRDDVRQEAVDHAMRALQAPLKKALLPREVAPPAPPRGALPERGQRQTSQAGCQMGSGMSGAMARMASTT